MNGEVQLIVNSEVPTAINSVSNDPTYVGIGALSRLIVTSRSEIAALTTGDQLTIINAAGNSVVKTLNSNPVIDSPVPGQTRLNFAGTWANDYSAAAGGYFMLTVGGKAYLDLYENESISQNWAFTDIGKFTTQAPFTRNFRIPLTATNQVAFGALFDPNINAGDATWFNYKLAAELCVDTIPLADGYLRVSKAYKQKDRIVDLDVTFYASTADFSKDVNQLKLADLDWTANNGFVNFANVNALSSGAFNLMYALVDRGQLFNQTNGRNTFNDNIYAGDLTPCVKWSYIFDKIFKEAGWSYDASEVINTIGEWWMPFCNSGSLKFSQSLTPQYAFFAYLNTDITLDPNGTTVLQPTTEGTDNGGRYTPGAVSQYKIPLHGTFEFQYWITYTVLANATTPNLTGTIQISIDNITQGTTAIVNTIFISAPDVTSTTNFQGITPPITANQNDFLRLRITYVNTSGLAATDVRIESGSSLTSGSGWQLSQITNAFYGFQLNLSLNAPDMRQIDFVTDVIKMLNCAVVPDPNSPKKLIIKPMDTFVGSGGISDWTSYLDIDKDITISSTTDYQKNQLKFTYSKGADSASKAYEQAKRIYGDYVIDGFTIDENTAPNEFTSGEQTIQLVTQSSPLLPFTGGSGLLKFVDDSGTFVLPGPRCLYRAGTFTLSKMFQDSSSTVTSFACPILSHYSESNPTVTDFDLNWAPEVPLYFIFANPYKNLYTQYWMNYLNGLYSPNARLMEASFALPFQEVVNVDFSKKIWIKDSYWRLLSINDYKIGALESTVCKLIKLIDAQPDCTGRPLEQQEDGEVIFVDVNDNIIPSTEACCTRYGYNWDATNEICWGQASSRDVTNSVSPARTRPVFTKATTTRSAGLTDQMVVYGDKITTDFTNVNSILAGETINVVSQNQNTLAVGENLDLTKSVAGNTMLGKNVTTNLPGIHVGGGYRDGNPTSIYYGWAQFGTFVLQSRPTITTSGDVVDLDIEGVAGEYINMPDDTLWSVLMNVTIKDTAGASETSLHHFTLEKVGGLSAASAITTISTIGAIGTNVFTFGVDTTTDTNEHRINVTVTGGTYPEDFFITASIQYQQSKTT
jgi:hypothetical protein